MKLTSTRVADAAKQIDARAIPDTGPTARSFIELFGDHTFFLDDDGLSIVEVETDGDLALGRVVKLAKWVDEGRTVLAPHPREVTNIVVALGKNA